MIPSDPPYIVHYSNELNLSDHNYFWDKQIFLESEFSAFVCPGQEDWCAHSTTQRWAHHRHPARPSAAPPQHRAVLVADRLPPPTSLT